MIDRMQTYQRRQTDLIQMRFAYWRALQMASKLGGYRLTLQNEFNLTLQVIKRVRYDKIPLQANIYPMPTQMFIEDQKKRLTLLTAQPLGCTSLHPGEIEVIGWPHCPSF